MANFTGTFFPSCSGSKAKYEKDQGWWRCRKPASAPRVWNGVENGINTLKDNICCAIGSGTTITLGLDPWVPGSPGHAGSDNSRVLVDAS